METQIIIVLAIMAFTIYMLVSEKLRIDVTAIVTMLLLAWSGVLTSAEALSGFSSNAVIAMIAVMIMGQGIAKTGMMARFSKWLLANVGRDKNKVLGTMSLSVGSMSAVMSNIGAAAMFLPSVLDVSRRLRISASEFIMPIGFMAIIGGALTMVGSGHLILTNDLLEAADLEPYGLFAVTPVGLALMFSAILFFLLAGKYIFPKSNGEGLAKTEQEKVMEAFNLHRDIVFYRIPASSSLVSKTVESSGLWSDYDLNLLAVSHENHIDYAPWRETVLDAGQILALYEEGKGVERFAEDYGLEVVSDSPMFDVLKDTHESGFVEIIVPPRSEMAGKTLRQFAMRKRYGVEPIMLFSRGERVRGDFSDYELKPGDTFIIYGPYDHIKALDSTDPFVVATPVTAESKKPSKMLHAAGSFALAIGLALSGFSISISFLTGAMVMVLTRVLSIEEAYKSIEWKVVFLLVGLIPLGIAMQNSGTAEFLASGVMNLIEGSHLIVLLFAVAVLATGFSLVMSNVGAVVVLAPLIVSIGTMAGVDPRPLVLLAAVNAGNSFILPTHQVNALMMTAGGYKTSDYFKAGGGMTLVFLLVSVAFFYLIMM